MNTLLNQLNADGASPTLSCASIYTQSSYEHQLNTNGALDTCTKAAALLNTMGMRAYKSGSVSTSTMSNAIDSKVNALSVTIDNQLSSKASTAYVDTNKADIALNKRVVDAALTAKADLTYVNNEINKKSQSIADIALDLATKEDKTAVASLDARLVQNIADVGIVAIELDEKAEKTTVASLAAQLVQSMTGVNTGLDKKADADEVAKQLATVRNELFVALAEVVNASAIAVAEMKAAHSADMTRLEHKHDADIESCFEVRRAARAKQDLEETAISVGSKDHAKIAVSTATDDDGVTGSDDDALQESAVDIDIDLPTEKNLADVALAVTIVVVLLILVGVGVWCWLRHTQSTSAAGPARRQRPEEESGRAAAAVMNPTYDVVGQERPSSSTTALSSVMLVPNVLYGAETSASPPTSTEGSAADREALNNPTYGLNVNSLSEMKQSAPFENNNSGNDADVAAPPALPQKERERSVAPPWVSPSASPTVSRPCSSVGVLGSAEHSFAIADAPTVTVAAAAPPNVQRFASGYVNTSYEVMAAMQSELPTMDRFEAERKLAAENVAGAFILRRKMDEADVVSISCLSSKGRAEHFKMPLLEDSDKRGAHWMHRAKPLPELAMVEAAIGLLRDKQVHSRPHHLTESVA